VSPAVATVVVAYESAGDLPRSLAAVRAQMRDGDELAVVDNAPGDGSAAVARAAGATVIEPGGNAGFAGGCHAGADATSAPLLFFLNPDAELAPGALDALRAAAAEQPGWGAWQGLVLLPGGREVNTAGGVAHWLGVAWAGGCGEPAAAAPSAPRTVAFASGAALVVRREAWDALGGFDPAYFMYCEDVDLSLRLRLAGWEVGLVPGARVEHEYAFAKGQSKWFLLERNRWWTVLGTYPAPLLALLAPALLAFEVALLAVALRGGWLRSKLRAQAAVLRSLPWALRRRARIQASRRVGAAAFARALSASLDSPFLGPAASHPVLRSAQAGYWGAVTRLLGRAHG
jgi:N-acetylglucosaminyl-diphospho-decaprenol L-rhamnosyltransferase